jgi:hypothetical protein
VAERTRVAILSVTHFSKTGAHTVNYWLVNRSSVRTASRIGRPVFPWGWGQVRIGQAAIQHFTKVIWVVSKNLKREHPYVALASAGLS